MKLSPSSHVGSLWLKLEDLIKPTRSTGITSLPRNTSQWETWQQLHFPQALPRFAIGAGAGDLRRSQLWQHLDAQNENKLTSEVPMVEHAVAVCVNTERLETFSFETRLFSLPIVARHVCVIRAHERSGRALFANLTSLLRSVWPSERVSWYFTSYTESNVACAPA